MANCYWNIVVSVLVINSVAGQELWRHTTSTQGNPLNGFQATHAWGEESLSVVSDPAGGSGNVLKVHYPKGSYSQTDGPRGAGFYSAPSPHHNSLTLSYDVYFSDNFDFVKGGKLPGLWGGGFVCTGGRHSDDCFTTRFMWRSGGAGEVYAYVRGTQRSSLCSEAGTDCNDQYGYSLGRGSWHFQKGKWQNIAQHVTLNTPGQHDGSIKVYYNGKLVHTVNDLSIRVKSDVQIDGMLFSTFFGGSESSWASTQNCDTYFKNFVISSGETPVIVG